MSDVSVREKARQARGAATTPRVCGYGSCDKGFQHVGDHRCRCGTLVDAPAGGCLWHTKPSPAWRAVIADRDAALSTIQKVREMADEWDDDFGGTERSEMREQLLGLLDGGE